MSSLLKLSQLGLEIDEALCLENLKRIVQRAAELGIYVRVDMEGSEVTERANSIIFWGLTGALPDPSGARNVR